MERAGNGLQGGFGNSSNRMCFYCGGTDIVTGLRVHQEAEAANVGLAYKAWKILWGAETLYADLCQSCGTVLRFYVRERNREWIREIKTV